MNMLPFLSWTRKKTKSFSLIFPLEKFVSNSYFHPILGFAKMYVNSLAIRNHHLETTVTFKLMRAEVASH